MAMPDIGSRWVHPTDWKQGRVFAHTHITTNGLISLCEEDASNPCVTRIEAARWPGEWREAPTALICKPADAVVVRASTGNPEVRTKPAPLSAVFFDATWDSMAIPWPWKAGAAKSTRTPGVYVEEPRPSTPAAFARMAAAMDEAAEPTELMAGWRATVRQAAREGRSIVSGLPATLTGAQIDELCEVWRAEDREMQRAAVEQREAAYMATQPPHNGWKQQAKAFTDHAAPLAVAFAAIAEAMQTRRGYQVLAAQEIDAAVARCPKNLDPRAYRAALVRMLPDDLDDTVGLGIAFVTISMLVGTCDAYNEAEDALGGAALLPRPARWSGGRR